MEAAASNVIAFLGDHRGWAFWIALVFAIAENLAVVSILIPSTAILAGVGALVATGEIAFLPIFGGAAIGALIGSTVSYWLGLRYGDRILALWPLRNHPDLMQRGKDAMTRWGPAAIIIGHFFGPLRPVIFLLCGMSAMPFLSFMLWNGAGSIAWAYIVPKFGEFGGEAIGWIWRSLTGA